MGLLLLIVLLLLIAGTVPTYPYSRRWGYRPSGVLSLILVILVVLVVLDWIPWGFSPTPVGTTVVR